MNRAKLKSYAPQARKDFIAAVTARANLLGLSDKSGTLEVAQAQTQGDVTVIAGQAWPAKVDAQRNQLIARIRKDGFAQTMEAVAYTWFNRFAALRYMELHDYLGHGHRALSSTAGGLPDILTHATDLSNSDAANALPGLNAAKVTELKLAGNRDGELYRMLLVAQCNALSRAMPFLFERIDDDSELLLPDNLLRSDSVIAKLVEEIPEEDWAQVEIIGWLYQFYISEKKDQVIGKVVKSEDIPAATQLFTPNWIVQYLVQNSVGRLWLMANPQSKLAQQCPYYITPAEQTPNVRAQLDALIQTRMDEDGASLNPETLTCLDPACGSGHILVVAYDVLKAIYLERGYQPRAIPRLILEKNLYGLDIDDRAAQLAGFALLMKARADNRHLFDNPPKLNVLALQESKGLDADALVRALQSVTDRTNAPGATRESTGGFGDNDLFPGTHPQPSLGESIPADTANNPARPAIVSLIEAFAHAKTFGSLIQIPRALNMQLVAMETTLQHAIQSGDLYARAAAQDLLPLVLQARVLGMQFDAVVANPPYMGSSYYPPILKSFVTSEYNAAKADLYACFIQRNVVFCKPNAFVGMITIPNWMFLSSFEKIRKALIGQRTIIALVHNGRGVFGSDFGSCSFILRNIELPAYRGTFRRLFDKQGSVATNELLMERFLSTKNYTPSNIEFAKIPGAPVAYWTSNTMRAAFKNLPLSQVAITRERMVTGNNELYLRLWYEVSIDNLSKNSVNREMAATSGRRWFPYVKGGAFRKWSGNKDFVVDWQSDGRRIRETIDPHAGRVRGSKFNFDHIFRPNVSWSALNASYFGARVSHGGALFDSTGPACFPDEDNLLLIAGFLNSIVAFELLRIINPTVRFLPGDIGNLPIAKIDDSRRTIISKLADRAVILASADDQQFEISSSFETLPLLSSVEGQRSLSKAWLAWRNLLDVRLKELQQIEEENNRHFINAYGLQDELSAEVPESQIALALADREKDSQRLISYAIGCMMGRYSLDEPGLIYAHAGNVAFEPGRYTTFPSDADGIVPITDELWFADDACSRIREFLRAVWGTDTLEENMAWLAASLGAKATETPDETIRRYIADKFFKDHLQTYKKRPIYWLFSSGKQGAFQALVYLHRYHEGTLARLRAEFVVPLTGKIQARIDMLKKDADIASSTAARNKLNKELEKLKKKHVELLAYDEQLRHYADMRIKLDLDDGVKVNYGKFGELLAEVKAVRGGTGDE